MNLAIPDGNDDRLETTPIFVLGLQRSGTSWVANVLCQHSRCVGIQSEDHHGIHESLFFSHFSRSYGDLSDEQCYDRFSNDFAQSDYFLLSDLPPEWLSQCRSRDYARIFHELMENVAQRDGATHWIEKSPHHSLYSQDLADKFPDATFICVLRNPVALLLSLLHAPWRERSRYPWRVLAIIRSCMSYVLYSKHLRNFAQQNHHAILLHYEKLCANPDDEMKRLCAFLNLPYQDGLTKTPFKKNSSFQAGADRSRASSMIDRSLIQITLGLFNLIPLNALHLANRLKNAIRPEPWPAWVWRRQPLSEKPPVVSG